MHTTKYFILFLYKKLLKSLENNYKFDYIFHQAAISDTTAIEKDIMIKTNVNAYEDLLKIAELYEKTSNLDFAKSYYYKALEENPQSQVALTALLKIEINS